MDNKGITAIVTKSGGVEFRSRLEARWSEMFTLLSWPWEYEPIDLDGYIPDFILTFPHKQMLVEVKPAMGLAECAGAVEKLARSGWAGEALIVGAMLFDCESWHAPAVGIMADCSGAGELNDPRRWSAAVLFDCSVCHQHSIFPADGDGRCRHRGCKSCGNTHIEDFNCGSLGAHEDARRMWYEAHKRTKWVPRNERKAV